MREEKKSQKYGFTNIFSLKVLRYKWNENTSVDVFLIELQVLKLSEGFVLHRFVFLVFLSF